uniref:Odorant receptor n=1 Tax=Streltzoviella insularis TaxID=1206366 RepID=A0A7D5YNU7_9NEOP|nr:odorant receptor 22 [Streltzoviella insularis]
MGINFQNIINKYSKTEGDRTEVDEIMTVALILQRIFGHQVLDPDWTWKKYFLHQFLTLLLFIYVFFGTLEVVSSTSDPELIAEASYTLVLIIICPIKLIVFINNRFIFKKLYVMAKTTLYEAIKADSKAKIEQVLNKGRKVTYTLFGMVVIPVFVYEVTTIWNYFRGRKILLSRSTSTLMPMTTPCYEVAMIFHSVFLTEVSSITIVMDMWFAFLMFFFCVASDGLVNILEVKSKVKYESGLTYAKRLNESLRKFHNAHVQQVEYLNTVNAMYKWLGVMPLCHAAMSICIVLLVISNDINWRFTVHMFPLFAEIFVYNWFGEQIKIKAFDLKTALLNFDWMGLEIKDRTRYYIIVMYISKEFGIKTAVGNYLSMITMSNVLKSSYQAFTVFQSVSY